MLVGARVADLLPGEGWAGRIAADTVAISGF